MTDLQAKMGRKDFLLDNLRGMCAFRDPDGQPCEQIRAVSEFCTSCLAAVRLEQAEADLLVCQQENQQLAVKERREFAWAEEYMAKSRHLDVTLERLQQGIAQVIEDLRRRADAIDHNAADGKHATMTVEEMLKLRAATYRDIAGDLADTLSRLIAPKE